ncbi:MAG: helix-turn-helix domain-containing protein [Bacteroidetes bacterium]|nr:MAG: helix-turn-helix domain-containing protein [Bacteroidota bacterium]
MVLNISKFIVLVLSAQMLIAQAPPDVLVENTLRVYPLDAHARVLVDSSASLDFEAIHRPDILEKFRPFDSSSVLLDPDRAYWLKTQITAKDNRTDTPTDLIREFRLCRAKEMLEQKSGNVSEIALEVGYSSLS